MVPGGRAGLGGSAGSPRNASAPARWRHIARRVRSSATSSAANHDHRGEPETARGVCREAAANAIERREVLAGKHHRSAGLCVVVAGERDLNRVTPLHQGADVSLDRRGGAGRDRPAVKPRIANASIARVITVTLRIGSLDATGKAGRPVHVRVGINNVGTRLRRRRVGRAREPGRRWNPARSRRRVGQLVSGMDRAQYMQKRWKGIWNSTRVVRGNDRPGASRARRVGCCHERQGPCPTYDEQTCRRRHRRDSNLDGEVNGFAVEVRDLIYADGRRTGVGSREDAAIDGVGLAGKQDGMAVL